MIELTTGRNKHKVLVNPSNISHIKISTNGQSRIHFNFEKDGSFATLSVYESLDIINEKIHKLSSKFR